MQRLNDSFEVIGGIELNGNINISGSKNSALACIVAAALSDKGKITLRNVPDIEDVRILISILKKMGKEIEFRKNMIIMEGKINKYIVPEGFSQKLRGSMYLISLLLNTMSRFEMEFPGGDKIGFRPLDIHIVALKKLGVEIQEYNGKLIGYVRDRKENSIFLKFPSVGATGNIMIFAVMIKGKVVIRNAAKEPEIVDLANLLIKMGSRISGAGTDTITIEGTYEIKGDIEHEIIPDRIEASTFMIIAAITKSNIRMHRVIVQHLQSLLSLLNSIGIEVRIADDSIEVLGKNTCSIDGFSVVAMPYPGIPTDIQPLLAVLALVANGDSVLEDRVFPNRFTYVEELRKFGATIISKKNGIVIKGNRALHSNTVEGYDIRAVIALMCAALIPNGKSVICGKSHLVRGYEKIEEKICTLGAKVREVDV